MAEPAEPAAEPDLPDVKIMKAGWRRPSIDIMKKRSSINMKILKPSELKKMGKNPKASPSSGMGGASSVLAQITQLREQLDADTKSQQQLHEVLDEILKTERHYLADLRYLHEKMLLPLKAMLKPQQHSALFSNLEQLLELHARLEGELGPREETAALENNDKGAKIASAFMTLLPFFKMYSTYCAAYVKINDSMADAKSVGAVAEFIDDKKEKENVSLDALLFRPVQRMCVYPLLFKQALGFTASSGAQHERFRKAFESVSATITQVNASVKQQEALTRMREIVCAEVSGGGSLTDLLQPTRSLVGETFVDMKCEKGASVFFPEWKLRRKYKWYIFSDVLMICRPNLVGRAYHKKLLVNLGVFEILEMGNAQRGTVAAEPSSAASSGDAAAPEAVSVQVRPAKRRMPMRLGSGSKLGSEGEGKVDKPEVLWIRLKDGAIYKCWAESAAERAELIRKIRALQDRLEEEEEDFLSRNQSALMPASRHPKADAAAAAVEVASG